MGRRRQDGAASPRESSSLPPGRLTKLLSEWKSMVLPRPSLTALTSHHLRMGERGILRFECGLHKAGKICFRFQVHQINTTRLLTAHTVAAAFARMKSHSAG